MLINCILILPGANLIIIIYIAICVDNCILILPGANFSLLWFRFTHNRIAEAEVWPWIGKVWRFITINKLLWNRDEISVEMKMNIYKATVRSLLLYACETWPLKAEETSSLEVFNHCWMMHKLRVGQWSHISNVEVPWRCAQKFPLSGIIK